MAIEEILIDITIDLIALEEYDWFVAHLFAKPAGEWVAVESLCGNWIEIKQHLQTLKNLVEADLYVTWLDFPQAQYGNGYCQIIFFCETLHWHTLALYNKQAFLSLKLLDVQKQVAFP